MTTIDGEAYWSSERSVYSVSNGYTTYSHGYYDYTKNKEGGYLTGAKDYKVRSVRAL